MTDSETVRIIVVAVLGSMTAAISLLQLKTNRQQLQSQLFERRMRIYGSTRRFLLDLHQNHPLSNDKLIRSFVEATSEAQFLFARDSDIPNYIVELERQSLAILRADGKNSRRDTNCQLWILEQIDTLAKRFYPYLSIKM